MGVFSSDTSPEVAAILVEGYRRMAPSDKLARVADLSRASRELAVAGTRLRYPDASEREIQQCRRRHDHGDVHSVFDEPAVRSG